MTVAYVIQVVVVSILAVATLIACGVGFIKALQEFRKQDEENGWR